MEQEDKPDQGPSSAASDMASDALANPPDMQPDQAIGQSIPMDDSPNSIVSPSSDVAMDYESDDEADNQPTTHEAERPQGQPQAADIISSKKRKSPEYDSNDDTGDAKSPATALKKVKLDNDKRSDAPSADSASRPSGRDGTFLPAEIWHRIFTFCPPRSLGNLLLINKLFHSYLDPSSTLGCPPPQNHSKSIFPALKPNAIWQASRRLFWPNMPTPLQEKTELDMWRLACSRTCQYCGKRAAQAASARITNSQHSGPGVDGVSTIWCFTATTCWACLTKHSVKEIDLLLSSSFPSLLMPALPFVFTMQEYYILSPSAVERTPPPAGSSLIKLFWTAQVNQLKEEFLSTKELGPSVSEEWLKGLEGQGAEKRQDASKWEKFDTSGGVLQMCTLLYPGYQPGQQAKTILPVAAHGVIPTPSESSTNHSQPPHMTNGPDFHDKNTASVGRAAFGGRVERTRDQAAELKASRKLEIERRAMLLEPPIPASVLAHMPAFQASIQIPTPLDENAWELLKPRLEVQRADAEARGREAKATTSAESNQRGDVKPDGSAQDNEPTDDDWDEIQAPVRARIAGLADEIIRDAWDDGDKLTKENSPKFAADVLIYVRKQFYEEVEKEAAAARAAGKEPPVDPPRGPFTKKLTLENMKWLFDFKVKPHTESYRKELFLCNGCESKYYGFEGVIQHFAAKHTSILSQGSVVVFWRAEWPAEPIFRPDGRPNRAPYMQQANPNVPPFNNHAVPVSHPPYGFTPYTSAPAQQSAAPYQGPQGQSYGTADQGYRPPHQGFYPPQGAYPPSQNPYNNYPQHTQSYQPYAPPAGAPGHNPAGSPAQGYGMQPPSGPYDQNYSAYQQNAYGAYPGPQGAPAIHPDRYRTQLEDLAQMSRELWVATTSLKDFPGGVRVHILIHHLAKRFMTKFSEAAPLTMFIDGLSNNKDMRPVRNINGIACKTCHLGLGDPGVVEPDRKWFSLPQLANHFQSKHIIPRTQSGQYELIPNWTTDMVLLPDFATLAGLRHIASQDQHKYTLISEALPELFAAPPAPVSGSQTPGVPPTSITEHATGGVVSSDDNHGRFYAAPHTGPAAHDPRPTPVQTAPNTYLQQSPAAGSVYDTSLTGFSTHQGANPGIATASYPTYQGQGTPGLNLSVHDQKSRVSSQGTQSGIESYRHGKKQKGAKGGKGNGKRGSGPDNQPNLSKAARAKRNEAMEAAAKKAEEEEKKQEEEIRAMWAADRAQTATGGPSSGPATGPGAPVASRKQTDNRKPKSTKTVSGPTSKRSTPSYPVKAAPPPRPAQDQDDDEGPSLLDALEMHLGQEQEQANVVHPPRQQAPAVYHDNRPGLGRRESESHLRYERAPPAEVQRVRSRTPPFHVRQSSAQQPAPYRERIPVQQQPEPVYHSRQSQDLDHAQYERAPRQDEYYPVRYADEPRARPIEHEQRPVEYGRRPAEYDPRPVEYDPQPIGSERYELIQVLGPEGEYYIRRPIRREVEVEIDGERYIAVQQDEHRPPPSRYVTHDAYQYAPEPARPGRYETQAPHPEPEYLRRDEPAAVEEYDPRFPALPPSSGGRQLRRYE